MPHNLSTNFKQAIDFFTPDILGTFWITEDNLTTELAGFDEINYLFDGLISQFLYGQNKSQMDNQNFANIFYTKNFNTTLFLAHIKNNLNIDSLIDEQIALIPIEEQRKKIIILNDTKKDWALELNKRYPKLEFKILIMNKLNA